MALSIAERKRLRKHAPDIIHGRRDEAYCRRREPEDGFAGSTSIHASEGAVRHRRLNVSHLILSDAPHPGRLNLALQKGVLRLKVRFDADLEWVTDCGQRVHNGT
ncbi:hypothetical protein GCM10009689_10870 [Brevibacterium antiquum]